LRDSVNREYLCTRVRRGRICVCGKCAGGGGDGGPGSGCGTGGSAGEEGLLVTHSAEEMGPLAWGCRADMMAGTTNGRETLARVRAGVNGACRKPQLMPNSWSVSYIYIVFTRIHSSRDLESWGCTVSL
jgi:hypothetical protein